VSETATDDGGGWIACSERMPEVGQTVEVRSLLTYRGNGRGESFGGATHWRPRPVDQHAVAACMFDDSLFTPSGRAAIAKAALHVAGCAECRTKLESKGGA